MTSSLGQSWESLWVIYIRSRSTWLKEKQHRVIMPSAALTLQPGSAVQEHTRARGRGWAFVPVQTDWVAHAWVKFQMLFSPGHKLAVATKHFCAHLALEIHTRTENPLSSSQPQKQGCEGMQELSIFECSSHEGWGGAAGIARTVEFTVSIFLYQETYSNCPNTSSINRQDAVAAPVHKLL